MSITRDIVSFIFSFYGPIIRDLVEDSADWKQKMEETAVEETTEVEMTVAEGISKFYTRINFRLSLSVCLVPHCGPSSS